ncbi:MAG: hypothetical protein HQ481_18005, partial [Alphaproteobacteria bacterium]|nr:hypothetical protein [Alphaproteobacteria bacterium]
MAKLVVAVHRSVAEFFGMGELHIAQQASCDGAACVRFPLDERDGIFKRLRGRPPNSWAAGAQIGSIRTDGVVLGLLVENSAQRLAQGAEQILGGAFVDVAED